MEVRMDMPTSLQTQPPPRPSQTAPLQPPSSCAALGWPPLSLSPSQFCSVHVLLLGLGVFVKQMVNPWWTYVRLSAMLMGSNGLTKASLAFLNYLVQIMFKSTKLDRWCTHAMCSSLWNALINSRWFR